MDKSIPQAAQGILAFIYKHESRGNYETISSNKQSKLPKPITKWTIDEILADSKTWAKKYGTLSSAAGAPQIIYKTMLKLKEVMDLKGTEKFEPDLQDRMAMQLLRFRGYDAFMSGALSLTQFAKNLAQEWASMPVLGNTKGSVKNVKRGQSYYAGDGLNAAGANTADEFERILKAQQKFIAPVDDTLDMLVEAKAQPASINTVPAPSTATTVTTIATAASASVAVVAGAQEATKSVTDWQPVIELAGTLTKWGPVVAGVIVVAVVSAIIIKKVFLK